MSVRVVARIRPLSKTELERDVIVESIRNDEEARPSVVRIPNPRNESESFSFQFNNVYEPETTQQELFDGEVAPTIKHLFAGFDVTIFAYGVTGTGKTHTMRGGKTLADRGVIPRLLSGIYRRSRKTEKDSDGGSTVQVSMSYYEIYNDKVFDLFEAPEKRTLAGLPLRDVGGKTVVAGLTERPCESLKDFENLYDQANVNRSTGSTKLNAHSSRSHAILCVNVSVTTDGQTRTSTASAIDLAGSEDNRRTENSKERLVESSSINKSLFVLAQCVDAISKKAHRIPYRESKMTRILSLGQNNGLTIMILNLSSARSYHLDTLSSLNVASRTKKIEVRDVENDVTLMGITRLLGTSTGLIREPLRPLTSATHNTNLNRTSEAGSKGSGKPKLFTVYADPRKSLGSVKAPPEKRSTPLKRPLESKPEPRATKLSRLSMAPARGQQMISMDAIEDLVERKVHEALVARGLEQDIHTPARTTDEVRRRLDALEQRIADQDDDERAEGLHFLLMAKQHYARGEDASALKMYEMARQHFPDNAKLEAKIAKVQARLQEKHEKAGSTRRASSLVFQKLGAATEVPALRPISKIIEDDETYQLDDESIYDCGAGARPRTKIRRRTSRSRTQVLRDVTEKTDRNAIPATPRSKQLLSIINTRSIEDIRALKGVGVKKAECIVDALYDSDVTNVGNLQQLGALRGGGVKTVETMRQGLIV